MNKGTKRYGDYGIEFANANIHVDVNRHDLKELRERHKEPYSMLTAALDEFDTAFVGDPWSAGNSDMGYTLYNVRRDVCYRILHAELLKFEQTGKIRLAAFEPDDDCRAEINA